MFQSAKVILLLFLSLVMSLWKQDLMTASMSEVSEVAVLAWISAPMPDFKMLLKSHLTLIDLITILTD